MCALYAHNSKVLCDHSSVNKLNVFITECIVFCFAITARPAWQGGRWPTQLLYRLIINIAHIRYCMCMCLIMRSVGGIQGQHTQNSTVQQRGYHLQIAAIIIWPRAVSPRWKVSLSMQEGGSYNAAEVHRHV